MLDVALVRPARRDDVTGTVLKAVADVMLDRPDEALKDLANPQVGNQLDAPIWRAIAFARQGKWARGARAASRTSKPRWARCRSNCSAWRLREALRAAIEVRDFNGAARMLNEFETIGVPPELEPSMARADRPARRGPWAATRTRSPLIALAAQFRATGAPRRKAGCAKSCCALRIGDMPRKDVIAAAGNAHHRLARRRDRGRRAASCSRIFTPRTAATATPSTSCARRCWRIPNSDLTRKIQDEAAVTFDSLFLGGKGDALPPIEALGLFYDYRELTPIGRRGDEMIRKLADRLVSVDLLDQAAELLQHQVDHRLQGAARAQVATRLAVIYLMNRKPDRALADAADDAHRRTLPTNCATSACCWRRARCPTSAGTTLALEVIANIAGPRGDPAARRHPVGGAALARGGRADRTALRRSLAANSRR